MFSINSDYADISNSSNVNNSSVSEESEVFCEEGRKELYEKISKALNGESTSTVDPDEFTFQEFSMRMEELFPCTEGLKDSEVAYYSSLVRKAQEYFRGSFKVKNSGFKLVDGQDRSFDIRSLRKDAYKSYRDELATAREFSGEQEIFGHAVESGRFSLSGLFDTLRRGLRVHGVRGMTTVFISSIFSYARGLAQKMLKGLLTWLLPEGITDTIYAVSVVLILVVCRVLDLGHCVAGLLNGILMCVCADSKLRVALSLVAMAYSAQSAAWNLRLPTTSVTVNNVMTERPQEERKRTTRVARANFQGGDLVDQVMEKNATFFTSIMKIFCCLIAVCAMDKLPSSSAFLTLLRKCKEVPQAFKGVLEVGKLVEGAFDAAFGTCFENCFGVGTMKANPIPTEVLDCTSRIIELTRLSNLARVAKEPALCAEADALYQQYSKFRVDYSGNSEVRNHLNMCAGNARDLYAQARSTSPKANEARTRPPAVIFSGPSGIGKSAVMNYVVVGVLAKEGLITAGMTDEEIELRKGECVYPRMPEQEYWDGYYGQTITIYDDFAQMKDSALKPNVEFFELIRTTNTFPCPLHMAELSQKANTYFSSKYIFMTSNADEPEIESLICPTAVYTRFALRVSVELDERIKRTVGGPLNGTIDSELVMHYYGTYNTPDIYRFKVKDGVNPEVTLNVRELVELIYQIRVKNEKGFNDLQKGVGEFARGFFQGWFDAYPVVGTDWRPNYAACHDWTCQKIGEHLKVVNERVKALGSWLEKVGTIKVISVMAAVALGAMVVYKSCVVDRVQDWKDEEVVFQNEDDPSQEITAWIYTNGSVGALTADYVDWSDRKWDVEEIREVLLSEEKQFVRSVYGTSSGENIEVYFFIHRVEPGETVIHLEGHKEEAKMLAAARAMMESGRTKTPVKKVAVESGRSKHFVKKVRVEKVAVEESGRSKNFQKKVLLEGFPKVRLEEWSSLNARESMLGPVRSAYWNLRSVGKKNMAPAVAIGGRCYLVNTHYWVNVQRQDRFFLTPWGSDTGFELLTSEVQSAVYYIGGEQTDVTMLLMPKNTPINRHIWRNFHTSADAALLDRQVCVLVSPVNSEGPLERCTGRFERMSVEPLDVDGKNGTVRLSAQHYVFDNRSYAGDCGGLYLVDDNTFEGKILAMHFGGAVAGGALAVPLIRHHFEFLADAADIVLPSFVIEDSNGEAPVVGAVYQGYVEEPPGMNMKTSIVKSMLHGKVQETTVMPAQLGYILDPDGAGLRGLKKIAGDVPYVDPESLDFAAESWKVLAFSGAYPKAWRTKLSIEESICGVPGRDYIKPINRTTSAGYPWVLSKVPGTKGKQSWLGIVEWDLSQPRAQQVIAEVQRLDQLLHEGKLEPSIFNDTLKDETRPIEKVLAGKTRVFSAAPMCGVILIRQYFGRFVDAITSGRIHNEVCVGIQAHSVDWTHMAARLRTVGNNVVAGDFTDFDGSLNSAILKKIFEIINEWYDDEWSRERLLLAEGICHSYHIAGPRVYRWTHSQPSGNPLTAILNSIYNSLATRMAWIYLAKKAGHEEFYPSANFNRHVRMVSYGDDNLISVSDEVKDWFNMEQLVEGYRAAGMKYTSEAKDGLTYTTKPLEECSFLKRGFRRWRGFTLAPLQQNSINEALNWCHKRANTRDVIEEMARTQVAEWALHDPKKFKEMQKKIQLAVLNTMNRYIEDIPQDWYINTMLFADYGTMFPMLCYA